MARSVLRNAFLCSLLLLLFIAPRAVFAQPCSVLDWNANYPAQVNAGQGVQITTQISVTCAQWRTFYSARVDLTDRSSGHLFSTSIFQIGWQPNVTATVSNAAIAPQTAGMWRLQLNLYIFEEAGMVGSFKHPFDINVESMNTPAQQTVTTAASPAPQSAPNESTVMLQESATVLTPHSTQTETVNIAITLGVVALIGAAVLFITRKAWGRRPPAAH